VLYSRPPHAHRRAVLFIHGYFATASVFAEWVPFFAARGMPAYAVNLRGRAGSGPEVNLGRTSITDYVAAISVGVYQGKPVLDLDYDEDSRCDTDMNVVMTGAGGFVEVQGTAEGAPFSRDEMNALLGLAEQGIRTLVEKQKAALGVSDD